MGRGSVGPGVWPGARGRDGNGDWDVDSSGDWDEDSDGGWSAGSDGDDRLRLSDVGKLARSYRRRVVRAARRDDEPTITGILAEHLRTDLAELQVVEESWPPYDLVNVQVGLDAWLAAEGREHRLLGISRYRRYDFGLVDLLQEDDEDDFGPGPGNVAWMNLPAGPDGEQVRAVSAGLYLVTVRQADGGTARLAAMLLASDPDSDMQSVRLHLVADRLEAAQQMAADLRRLAVELNVFRGQVISFGRDMFGDRSTVLQFHRRPSVGEEQVILPAETMAAVRRQVVGVAEHRTQLLAAGQHLKRGLLLYGPPGVGKTHSVRFLLGQMTGVTIILLSGEGLGAISTACSVARTLQPAMIVVEDVDLIAHERGGYGGHPLLFQLLNEMDGLAEDVDVVFLLTTNQPEALEPALAQRPGRVDQAVELELPDAEARRRLFALYRGGLDVDESRLDTVIERTEGVTASFLKELLRRAAVLAASAGAGGGGAAPLHVSADHLDAALDELMDTRNAMTRVLLGGRRGED